MNHDTDDLDDDSNEIENESDTFSVVSPPVFDRPASEIILFIIAQAPLHYLLGGVNFGLDKLEAKHPIVAKRWLKACGVTRNCTFGHALNGNSCRTLLKKAYLLTYISSDVKDFVTYFEAMVEMCLRVLATILIPII